MDHKVNVHLRYLEMAINGMMGMFGWKDGLDSGLVEEDWYDQYCKLAQLHSKILRGELAHIVELHEQGEDAYEMTRKDYEKIAAALAKSWIAYCTNLDSKLAVSNVINNICDTLKADNPNFSREMFIARIENLVGESNG